MTTINTLLMIASCCGWKLHQLEVSNVFLHDDPFEEDYMDLPPLF